MATATPIFAIERKDRPLRVGIDTIPLSAFVQMNKTPMSADRGDNNVTLTVGTDYPIQSFATVLTGNKVVTLSTTDAVNGDWFWISRAGLGAFTLDVGGLKTIASLTAGWVLVVYNGSAWVLVGYGLL